MANGTNDIYFHLYNSSDNAGTPSVLTTNYKLAVTPGLDLTIPINNGQFTLPFPSGTTLPVALALFQNAALVALNNQSSIAVSGYAPLNSDGTSGPMTTLATTNQVVFTPTATNLANVTNGLYDAAITLLYTGN